MPRRTSDSVSDTPWSDQQHTKVPHRQRAHQVCWPQRVPVSCAQTVHGSCPPSNWLPYKAKMRAVLSPAGLRGDRCLRSSVCGQPLTSQWRPPPPLQAASSDDARAALLASPAPSACEPDSTSSNISDDIHRLYLRYCWPTGSDHQRRSTGPCSTVWLARKGSIALPGNCGFPGRVCQPVRVHGRKWHAPTPPQDRPRICRKQALPTYPPNTPSMASMHGAVYHGHQTDACPAPCNFSFRLVLARLPVATPPRSQNGLDTRAPQLAAKKANIGRKLVQKMPFATRSASIVRKTSG